MSVNPPPPGQSFNPLAELPAVSAHADNGGKRPPMPTREVPHASDSAHWAPALPALDEQSHLAPLQTGQVSTKAPPPAIPRPAHAADDGPLLRPPPPTPRPAHAAGDGPLLRPPPPTPRPAHAKPRDAADTEPAGGELPPTPSREPPDARALAARVPGAPARPEPVESALRFVVVCAKHPARLLQLERDGKVRFHGGPSHGSWSRCPIDEHVIHVSWNWASDESKLKMHCYRKVATTDCWEPEKTPEEFWHVLALSPPHHAGHLGL